MLDFCFYLNNFISFLLALNLLFAVPVLFLSMQHNSMAEPAPQTGRANCISQTGNKSSCLEYHLGVSNKISEALPAPFHNFGQILFWALFVISAGGLLAGLLELKFRIILSRWRLWQQLSKNYFYRQLGFWLALIQKREPARGNLRRGFKFAMAIS